MAKMNVNPHNAFVKQVMGAVQHYNPEKYWKRRAIVVDPKSKTPKLLKLFYLYYIKKCDAFNNASLGTDLHQGAVFEGRPELPHGLNGIIIHLKAHIGRDAVIWQQVTIGSSGGGLHISVIIAKLGQEPKFWVESPLETMLQSVPIQS